MITDTQQHTTAAGIANSSARVLPEHTVCLSRTASVGYVLVMGRPMATSQDFVNWVCRGDLDWRWLKYILQSEKAALLRFASGTTHQTIYFPEVKAFHILSPPPDEQNRICDVLWALDTKIESNRRLAALLEETVAALFRARFIDFVGVTDLVESEIGPIPRDWTVRPLSHLGRFINGGALTKDATGSGRLIIRIAEMKNGPGASTKYTDAPVADDQVARPGDLLFAWSGSLGVSRWTLPEAVINQHIFKCVPSGDVPQWLLEQCLLDALPEFIRIAADKATTMGHIRRRDLDSPRWAVPPPKDLTEIDEAMAPLLQRRIGCLTESHLLAELRDTLLPKLVSGQIRVREAEEMAEAV